MEREALDLQRAAAVPATTLATTPPRRARCTLTVWEKDVDGKITVKETTVLINVG